MYSETGNHISGTITIQVSASLKEALDLHIFDKKQRFFCLTAYDSTSAHPLWRKKPSSIQKEMRSSLERAHFKPEVQT